MKKFLSFISLCLVMFFVTSASAIDIFSAGDIVNSDGDFNSTRFIAGNTVTSTGNIDGLSFIAGNEITSKSVIPYGFYAGNIINIKDSVSKDLFVAGNTINIDSSAELGRDVYVAGTTVNIKTNIERDLRAGGSVVNISGITIKGDAYIAAEEIVMDNETEILGKLVYPEDSVVTGAESAKIGDIEVTKVDKVVIEFNVMDFVKGFIVSSIAAFISIIVLLYIFSNSKEKLDNLTLDASSIIKNIGIGFLVLIALPIAAIIALFTGILTPIALISFVVYFVSMYISGLLVYYIVGNVISKNIIKNDNQYLAIAVGVVVVKLIKLIPIVGGFVSAFSLFYGLGLIFKYITRKDK